MSEVTAIEVESRERHRSGQLTRTRDRDSLTPPGLVSLVGQKVTLYCFNYFYTGVLESVDSACVRLSAPSIIFEPVTYTISKEWAKSEKMPTDIYVMLSAIEAFSV